MNLELMAMHWLRSEKRCEIVLRERSPRAYPCGQPDVLGVTSSRFLIEVEIKRSVSDFKRDFLKISRRNRDLFPAKQARQFFYFVPANIVEKVEPLVPDWSGLLYVPDDGPLYPYIKRKAPLNKLSHKLSDDEFQRLFAMLTNHLLSAETSRDNNRQRFFDGHQPWENPNSIYYDI